MRLFLGLVFISYLFTKGFGQVNETVANYRTDTFVNARMKALHIPGLAVAVVKNGKAIKIAAYGMANLEWNNKVTEHTSFQIASCTKLLTSTLLLKAIYNRKIALDDFVEKYIDSVPAAWKKLQIKHLITHSSGLKNFNGDMYVPTTTVVRALKDSTLEYESGKGQHYAQLDFMLLGHILEKIYGKPFAQLLKEEVAIPLGMNDGGFDMEQKVVTFMRTDLIKQKVTTYYDLDGKMQAYKFMYPQYTYTAGGYFASISDMANWAIGLDKGALFPKTFAEDLIYNRDSVGNAISEFTKVGWALENEEGTVYAGHSGGPGLGDVWRFAKEGYTFIVLSNDGELLPDFARAIAALYIKNLAPKPEITKFER